MMPAQPPHLGGVYDARPASSPWWGLLCQPRLLTLVGSMMPAPPPHLGGVYDPSFDHVDEDIVGGVVSHIPGRLLHFVDDDRGLDAGVLGDGAAGGQDGGTDDVDT